MSALGFHAGRVTDLGDIFLVDVKEQITSQVCQSAHHVRGTQRHQRPNRHTGHDERNQYAPFTSRSCQATPVAALPPQNKANSPADDAREQGGD